MWAVTERTTSKSSYPKETMDINLILDKIQAFAEKYVKPDYFFQHPQLWIALFVAIFISFFILHQLYIRQNVVSSVVNARKDALSRVKTKDQEFADEFGAITHKTLIYKLDRLILTSGVKRHLKFMNAESYLITVVTGLVAGLVVGTLLLGPLFGIFAGTAIVTLLYIWLIAKANRTYTAIEDQTSVFVSLLCNHAKGSSDIVMVMKRTLPNLSEPLYSHVKTFLLNADAYGSTDIAFDIMKESVDNKRFKIIITNLKTCSHYEANYEEVLQQMVSQITAELSSREERKTILLNGKITVASLSVITVLILVIIANMLAIPIKAIMFETFIGQCLCLLMGLLYLYVLTTLFAADRN